MHFMRETRTEIGACKQLKAHKTRELVKNFQKKMKYIVGLAALLQPSYKDLVLASDSELWEYCAGFL